MRAPSNVSKQCLHLGRILCAARNWPCGPLFSSGGCSEPYGLFPMDLCGFPPIGHVGRTCSEGCLDPDALFPMGPHFPEKCLHLGLLTYDVRTGPEGSTFFGGSLGPMACSIWIPKRRRGWCTAWSGRSCLPRTDGLEQREEALTDVAEDEEGFFTWAETFAAWDSHGRVPRAGAG